jgi:hypothetical protein
MGGGRHAGDSRPTDALPAYPSPGSPSRRWHSIRLEGAAERRGQRVGSGRAGRVRGSDSEIVDSLCPVMLVVHLRHDNLGRAGMRHSGGGARATVVYCSGHSPEERLHVYFPGDLGSRVRCPAVSILPIHGTQSHDSLVLVRSRSSRQPRPAERAYYRGRSKQVVCRPRGTPPLRPTSFFGPNESRPPLGRHPGPRFWAMAPRWDRRPATAGR